MAAQADAGVWQKAAPVAVEGLATAAQAADAVVCQKAMPAAVRWRGTISIVSVVQRTVCTRVWLCVCAPSLARTVHVRCGGCAWRSCVCIPTPTAE